MRTSTKSLQRIFNQASLSKSKTNLIKAKAMAHLLKKIGIISGMGTRAGLLFIDKLIARIEAPKDQDFPEFILHNNSRIPDRTLAIVYGEESPMNELLRSINLMKLCNVDFIISTCITSYHFLNQLDPHLTQNILNPVALLSKKLSCEGNGIKRVGLLATTGTIRSGLFHNEFVNSPFELVVLDPKDQESEFMRSVYMDGGFKSAQVSTEAYELFQNAVNALKSKEVDVIVGGCTEVQIGFSRIAEALPYIDLVDLLVDEAIEVMGLNKKLLNKELAYNEY